MPRGRGRTPRRRRGPRRRARRPRPSTIDDRAGVGGVLRGVLHGLQAAEVDRVLHLGRIAAHPVRIHRRRDRQPERGGAQRLGQAAIGQQRGVHPARQRLDLLQRLSHLVAEGVQLLEAALAVLFDQLFRQLELDAQGHQPLLRSVVKVAFDSPPLPVAARQDAGPRTAHLDQRGLDPVGQPPVLERDERVGGHRLHEVHLVAQGLVVHDAGHQAPALANLGEAQVRARLRRIHGPSFLVDPPAAAGALRGVDDLQRRVADRVGHEGPEVVPDGASARAHAQPL